MKWWKDWLCRGLGRVERCLEHTSGLEQISGRWRVSRNVALPTHSWLYSVCHHRKRVGHPTVPSQDFNGGKQATLNAFKVEQTLHTLQRWTSCYMLWTQVILSVKADGTAVHYGDPESLDFQMLNTVWSIKPLLDSDSTFGCFWKCAPMLQLPLRLLEVSGNYA